VPIVTLLYSVGIGSRANYHPTWIPMSRVRFVDHHGKRIIRLDFAGITDAEKGAPRSPMRLASSAHSRPMAPA
jgi:hypothetical protein